MAKKIRLTRKQIKQPDEFLTWTEQAWEWASQNVYYLLAGIAGILIVLILIWMAAGYIKGRSSEPEQMLADGIAIMRAPILPADQIPPAGLTRSYTSDDSRYRDAAKAFDELHKKYQASTPGQLALLYLGESYERLGQYDRAIEFYEQFLKSETSRKRAYLRLGGTLGLARSLFGQGKLDESLAKYNEVIDANDSFKDAAMIGAARVLYAKDQKTQGKELLAKARQEFPDSFVTQPADFLTRYWEQNPPIPAPPKPAGEGIGSSIPSEAAGLTTGSSAPETGATAGEPAAGATVHPVTGSTISVPSGQGASFHVDLPKPAAGATAKPQAPASPEPAPAPATPAGGTPKP